MTHTTPQPTTSIAVSHPCLPTYTPRIIGQSVRRDGLKRVFDVLSSLSLILAALPFLLLIVASLLLLQGRPILIGHRRVGRGGRSFRCLKFRSMVTDAEAVLQRHLADDVAARIEWAASHKLKRDPRITPLGRVLRRWSVDELPQLLNILRGDMSLVGPRPIVEGELSHYGTLIHHYYSVRPGLTGRWQISGRSDLSYGSRVLLDVEYVQSRTFGQDLVILLKTVPAVLVSTGSY